jgi:integrase
MVEKCLENTEIADFCWHDLRHTFASRPRRAGAPIEDIADLLDHKIPALRIVTRFAHADIERLRSAVATLVQADKEADTKMDAKTDTAAIVEFPATKAV